MSNEHVTIKKAEDETTEIICILDRSTSIETSGLTGKTIEGFNAFLADQKKVPGKATLTLCLFDGDAYGLPNKDSKAYEIVHAGIDIHDVPNLTPDTFKPKGMTAMYDAIGITINNVYDRIQASENKPDKVVVLIMTDGEENSSREYTMDAVSKLIDERKSENNWAFIFIGANIDTMKASSGLNISKGNTLKYSNTGDGVNTAYMNMSSSVSNVRLMRSVTSDFSANLDNLIDNNGTAKEDIQ